MLQRFHRLNLSGINEDVFGGISVIDSQEEEGEVWQ